MSLVPEYGAVPCAIDQVIKRDDVEDKLVHQAGV
jgi:hypothetical protein